MNSAEKRGSAGSKQVGTATAVGSESAQLAGAAMALLGCRTAEDVYQVIGDFMALVCPGAVIIVDEIAPDLGFFVTRHISGIEHSLVAKSTDLIGFEIVGKRWAIPDAFRDVVLSGTLARVPGGFAGLVSADIPKPLAAVITRMFGLRDLFTVGISDGRHTLGNIAVVMRTQGVDLPTDVIDSFAHHCYSTLIGIEAHRALRSSEERYRAIAGMITSFVYSCRAEAGQQYRIDWMAGAVEDVTGYTVDEVRERTCWRFMVLREDRPIFDANVIGLKPRCSARTGSNSARARLLRPIATGPGALPLPGSAFPIHSAMGGRHRSGEDMAGFCGGCGQPLADDACFCVTCGKPTVPEAGAALLPPVDPNAAPVGYAPGAPTPVYGAAPMPGPPYAIPPANALPPRPAMSRKAVIIMVAVVAVIGLGYLGWTTIPPLLTSPASVADQFVRAAESRSDSAVSPLAAPELGASDASDALFMLDDASFTPAFKVESQQGLSAVVTMRSDTWDYRLTVARPWNGPWRVSRIELTRSEVQTETVSAPTDPEYVDWELWPSSESEITLSDAKDGERTYTVIYTMVNGESDQVEGSSTVTVQAVAAKTLRGTGLPLSTYGTAYSPNGPGLVGSELSTSMQVAIDPSVGAAAPKGAKLQAHIRTPDGTVVDSDVVTNSGKADANSYYYMTATWNWTPGLMKEKGDAKHPTDSWLPGTYAIVYTANDEVVGANYWQSSQ